MEWFKDNASGLMQQLEENAQLKRWGRGIPQGRLLFEHVKVVSIEPAQEDLAAWEHFPPGNDHPVRRVQNIYQVRVPTVAEGQQWVALDGEVVIGYYRPQADSNEEKRWEEVRDGRRITHTELRSSVGRTEPISVKETPQSGDQRIVANECFLYIDENGVVYF